jgi:hypothetical protein
VSQGKIKKRFPSALSSVKLEAMGFTTIRARLRWSVWAMDEADDGLIMCLQIYGGTNFEGKIGSRCKCVILPHLQW